MNNTFCEHWLETLSKLTENQPKELTPNEAFDIIVTHGRLQRVKPEIVQEAAHDGELERLDAYVSANYDTLAHLSKSVFDTDGWFQNATEWVAFSDKWSDEECTSFATELLNDFDDIQIYHALNGGYGNVIRDMQVWFEENRDTFPFLKPYCQDVAGMFRNNLSVPLAATCVIHQVIAAYQFP